MAATLSNDKSNKKTAQDENAVNREIAALLLNLHASRTNASPAATAAAFQKAEDLSIKAASSQDTGAIDLTKTKVKSDPILHHQPQIPAGTNITKVNTTTNNLIPNGTSSNPYSSFYPSLATMSNLNPSTLATMNSNYLLQNLLLGKMQQMASSTTTSTTSSSTSSSPLSFPTQPLPASQALSLPATSTSLKPPPAVLKSVNVNLPSAPVDVIKAAANNGLHITPVTAPAAPAPSVSAAPASSATNIPLLCGQIVAQLNGLLFLVHSLNNSQIEASLQTQLSAIYARLQEIVTMVEQAKKQQEEQKEQPKLEIHKQLEKLKESKKLEEEKIAKHIQDYQRALLQQQQQQQLVTTEIPGQIAPLKETMTSSNVVNLLKKQAQANLDAKHFDKNGEIIPEVESSTNAANAARRRRGRPPKNSNMDLTYSPPDKKSRMSTDSGNHAESTTTEGGVVNQKSVSTTNGGGKGIRNRVFCGECAGCLKNDDCGRCRYCQDKTKFGGQNRLRQKCLHRRCQMDTHRRRNNNHHHNNNNNNALSNGVTSTAPPPIPPTLVTTAATSIVVPTVTASSFQEMTSARQSPSPNAIYSGVDLARLAATAAAAEKIGEVKDEDEDIGKEKYHFK